MATVVDTGTETLERLSRALKNTEALNKVIAQENATLFEDHFRAIGAKEKNKFGRPSTFWSRMIGETKPIFSKSLCAIQMNRAIAQRYFGGPIRPTGGRKFLTIPVSKEAYGKSARSFHGLFVFRYGDVGKNGSAFLAKSNRKVVLSTNSGPQKKERITLLYQLLARVIQKKNPSILPTDSEIAVASNFAVTEYLKRKNVF